MHALQHNVTSQKVQGNYANINRSTSLDKTHITHFPVHLSCGTVGNAPCLQRHIPGNLHGVSVNRESQLQYSPRAETGNHLIGSPSLRMTPMYWHTSGESQREEPREVFPGFHRPSPECSGDGGSQDAQGLDPEAPWEPAQGFWRVLAALACPHSLILKQTDVSCKIAAQNHTTLVTDTNFGHL